MHRTSTVLTILGVLLLAAVSQSEAADWPQWQGLHRDGRSPETGLLKQWPEGGPELLTTIPGLGRGYATPSVVDGRIYVTAKIEGDLMLYCFDSNGEKLWEIKHGKAFGRDYAGARSAPTIEDGRLYLMSGVGVVAAYDLEKKEQIWSVDVVEKFEGKIPQWGYAESVLIDGEKLICAPGGPEALVVALNKNNGELIWKTKRGVDGEIASYGSAIVFEHGGVRQIALMTSKSLIGVAAMDGRPLWRFDRPANNAHGGINCSTPLFEEGIIFGATGYGHGGGAAKLVANDGEFKAEQIWETREMKAHHGGYIYHEGYVYGNNDNRGWSSFNLKTGENGYLEKGVGKGSITYADGMLYILSERGEMSLVEAAPESHKIVSRFKIPTAGGETWPHPVISDGKLYLRRHDQMFVYDIQAK